jgi:hypothetical protein
MRRKLHRWLLRRACQKCFFVIRMFPIGFRSGDPSFVQVGVSLISAFCICVVLLLCYTCLHVIIVRLNICLILIFDIYRKSIYVPGKTAPASSGSSKIGKVSVIPVPAWALSLNWFVSRTFTHVRVRINAVLIS